MNLIDELEQYIKQRRPLGISDFDISDLGAGEYNQNFIVKTNETKLVLRVSVSQLSGAVEQLRHEYETLEYLNNYDIAPKPLYLDMDGFKYPLMFEEFIEGDQLISLEENVLKSVGASIAEISNIPIKQGHPFEVRQVDYQADLKAHVSILNNVELLDEYSSLYQQAKQHLEQLLSELTHPPTTQSMFIRRDANPTNIMVTGNDIKWIDWEIARVDDPTITLASFVNEMLLYDVQKLGVEQRHMDIVIKQFKNDCPIVDFDDLLENRLKVERIGGLVWGIERMNNFFVTKQSEISRLEWYKVICEKSLDALNN